MFNKYPPSIKMTLVGFGQAGTRMVDKFAELKYSDGKPIYNCLALNSNDGDLKELKYIPKDNQTSLKLGGLGKNPEKAERILNENEYAKETLKSFIRDKVRPDDELVLFFAGLGGGTGTSTIIKAIDEFYEYNNKPIILEEFKEIQSTVEPAELKANLGKYKTMAFRSAESKFIKIGIVVTLPVRSDGPDVLRQVNTFANKIWKIANDPVKGIAFVIFADNQHFLDTWTKLGTSSGFTNYRDYANNEIVTSIHSINSGTNGGGTSITFDPQDFKRIIKEGMGSLVIGKVQKRTESIYNNSEVTKMFMEAIQTSNLHDPIALEEEDEYGNTSYAKVHHLGLLAILDKDMEKIVGSSFIDQAKEEAVERLPLNGTVFSGYLLEFTGRTNTAYTFYKTAALPKRLSKGLVEEFQEYQSKHKNINYKIDSIQEIATSNEEILEIELDLSEFGIELEEEQNKQKDQEYIDLNTLDFSNLDID